MFENNCKTKGGSPYIQSKVLNAKDCLSIYLGEQANPDAMPTTAEDGAKPKPPNDSY